MSNTEALVWVWIYLGMIVGAMTWIILMVTIYFDFKDKDKK